MYPWRLRARPRRTLASVPLRLDFCVVCLSLLFGNLICFIIWYHMLCLRLNHWGFFTDRIVCWLRIKLLIFSRVNCMFLLFCYRAVILNIRVIYSFEVVFFIIVGFRNNSVLLGSTVIFLLIQVDQIIIPVCCVRFWFISAVL